MNMYDLAIIGGGPAGYTAASLAGKNGLRTVLFEKSAVGGVCLHEGCIPTKALLHSAKVFRNAREASRYGVACESVTCDLSKVIARKNKIVRKLSAGIRATLQEAGVETVTGAAMISDAGDGGRKPKEILCNGQTYLAEKLLLCTGSEPVIPPVPGLDTALCWTSREALETKIVPDTLLIIGGGATGIEFAAFFNTLGSQVTVVEMQDEILPGMDGELASLLRNDLSKRGVTFHLGARATAVSGSRVTIEKAGERTVETVSRILLNAGRKPVLTGFDPEACRLELERGGVKVDLRMQTSSPGIYACGDITGFSMLAHTAVKEAETAVGHILGHNVAMSYKAIPGVVYAHPEMAGAGMTEDLLKSSQTPYNVRRLPMTYSGRFVVENEQETGLCKILTSPDGKLLGVHLLGCPASEMIITACIAIEKGWKAETLKAMIFPHPTVGEIIKETL